MSCPLLIGSDWSLALARKVHLKIDPIMTILCQDHELVAEHSYLVHPWFTQKLFVYHAVKSEIYIYQ